MASYTDDERKLVINEDEAEMQQGWSQVGGGGNRRDNKRLHSPGDKDEIQPVVSTKMKFS